MKSKWIISLDFDTDYSRKEVENYLDSCLDFSDLVDYEIFGS